MNTKDYHKVYVPAVRNIFGQDVTEKLDQRSLIELFKQFDRLIGEPGTFAGYCKRPPKYDFPIKPELRELLIKLAGPNGKFILKVYRAQKGL